MPRSSLVSLLPLICAPGLIAAQTTRPFDAVPPTDDVQVAVEPSLQIGVMGGDPEYEFTKITDVALLPDGSVAVLELTPPRVRIYSADGSFVRDIGREGQGPGEFQAPFRLTVTDGGHLLVWDPPVRQVVTIDPATGVVDQDFVRDDPPAYHEGEILPDGSRLIRHVTSGVEQPEDRVWRRPAVLKRVADGVETTLTSLTGREMWMDRRGAAIGVPFAVGPVYAGGGPDDVVVTGDGSSWDLQVWDASGDPLHAITGSRDRRSATPEEMESERADFEREAGMWGEEVMNRIWSRADLEDRTRAPTYEGVWVDACGDVWAGLWNSGSPTGIPQPTSALVFDPDGRLRGSVDLPDNVQITEIGTDRLVGVSRDRFRVERVVIYPITRSEC